MRIDKLQLKNFKKFAAAKFTFNPHFTVLIGNNATGKTSVLDALSILLGSYLLRSGINPGRNGIKKEEARLLVVEKKGQVFLQPQDDAFVAATGWLHNQALNWRRNVGDRGADAKNIIEIGTADRKETSEGADNELPLLLYYGLNSLQYHPGNIELTKPDQREAAYRNCLNPKSDLHLFQQWYRQLSLASMQQGKEIPALKTVRDAVVACIPDARHFYHDIANDQLMIDLNDSGLVLFSQLSDGYRKMVSMVADIAHRASRLNPQFGVNAAQQTKGVVLVDEIDLHLHPKWQRTVVNNLKNAFENLQFIVTTHSPFILQSLAPGEVIDLEQPQSNEAFQPANAIHSTKAISENAMATPSPKETFSQRSIEDITEGVMAVELPQRSYRYQQMHQAAKQYYTLLQDSKQASDEEKERLKTKLDELSAPFSDNIAYHAFLEMERMMAGLDKTAKIDKEKNE